MTYQRILSYNMTSVHGCCRFANAAHQLSIIQYLRKESTYRPSDGVHICSRDRMPTKSGRTVVVASLWHSAYYNHCVDSTKLIIVRHRLKSCTEHMIADAHSMMKRAVKNKGMSLYWAQDMRPRRCYEPVCTRGASIIHGVSLGQIIS